MNKERLKNGLEKMGIAADETALDRFEAFHAILDEYNARMDLTAVLDEDERVDRHDPRRWRTGCLCPARRSSTWARARAFPACRC